MCLYYVVARAILQRLAPTVEHSTVPVSGSACKLKVTPKIVCKCRNVRIAFGERRPRRSFVTSSGPIAAKNSSRP
eukprot:8800780-Pyramimonas_sp.AAC.1